MHRANRERKDEFYTQLPIIENELKHYKTHFKNKTVFCNCDDPFESNFFRYFAMNFNHLGLKKLICTCYAGSPVAYTELNDLPLFHKNEKLPYMIEITEVKDYNKDGAEDLSDIEYLLRNNNNTLTILDGDGDFRSEESIGFLEEADIVVTNPPFSLFRQYVAQLIRYNKQFLIIGNLNAITYKEIFPLIKENKMWLGCSLHATKCSFLVPDDYEGKNVFYENGVRKAKVNNAVWFTNLDIPKRHEDIILYKKYNPEEYPKYDNYDAIEVSRVSDIPCDYYEDIGVPITYLDKHNPDQFEIVKFRKGNDEKDLTYTLSSDAGTERERTQDHAILQNHHQEKDVMALSEYQLPSSTNTTQSNLKSLVSTDTSQTTQDTGIDSQLTEKKSTQEYSLRGRCNGIMGVPITFLDKYNPEQFEIINGIGRYACIDADYTNPPGTYGTDINGKHTYFRILIKRRRKNEN